MPTTNIRKGDHISLCGLASRPDLNGVHGRVRAVTDRIEVVTETGEGVRVKLENVERLGDDCFVEHTDDMILLSRRLPSGRTLHVDTLDGEMLRGGQGILHKNFINSDNRVTNLAYVTEIEARKALMAYEE